MNWPNHLMEPSEVEDLFLLELISLDPVNPAKGKSMLLSLTPSGDTFNLKEQEAGEVEEDLLAMTDLIEMESLLTKSPMATTSRIWSLFPRPMTSRL
jgi:hypothetical protein